MIKSTLDLSNFLAKQGQGVLLVQFCCTEVGDADFAAGTVPCPSVFSAQMNA